MVSMSLRTWVEVRGVAVGAVVVLGVGGAVRVANIVNERKHGYGAPRRDKDETKTKGNRVCCAHSMNGWFLFVDSANLGHVMGHG